MKAHVTPLNIEQAFESLTELWSPKVVASLNGQFVKVAKVHGEFPRHAHTQEDELFYILRGRLRLDIAPADGGPVELGPGEMYVVPRGVLHQPSASEETWVMLLEPASTLHTGDAITPQTRSIAEQLA